eukprot:TRINITY_DN67736_c0_g1_i1.p1 TRINITY_DN67736_c0_g1~~TRINITY_DN67736_c0_g1_i1.p1  ORF type:complete len:262 (+),score=45.65 TRINITY_DN67736_c0_g1_i1:33-818(+)
MRLKISQKTKTMKLCLTLMAMLGASTLRLAYADCPADCPPRCPKQEDTQAPWIKEKFDYDKFWGTFYELAYHDNTQPQRWPLEASCQRSVKSRHPEDPKKYKDLFSLHFGWGKGFNSVCDLEFDITDKPGVFMGHWSGSMRPDLHDVHNTVVDVGVAANGTYTWTLEFQCKDDPDPNKGIHFAAVNFYHRNPLVSDEEFNGMMERLKARGLGWVVKTAPGLKMVNQKQCVDAQSYPASNAKPSYCGQSFFEGNATDLEFLV